MKKQQQEPITIPEQILNLKSLGLIVEDEATAEAFLNDVSYFRFVKAYSLGLKPKNGSYYSGVTFEQMKELYLFNTNFRHLIFGQLERIEVSLRCRISNHFSCKYGALDYKFNQNFENPVYHESFLLEAKSEIMRRRREPFVKNYQTNYESGDLPFYALVEIFSFGLLSKFYKNMKSEDKKAIAAMYNVNYTYLESWIESFAYVRNICAHYGRLYNAKLTKTPMLYRRERASHIANTRVFSVLCCLSYLLPHDQQWASFVTALSEQLKMHPHVQKECMGIPENWEAILLAS